MRPDHKLAVISLICCALWLALSFGPFPALRLLPAALVGLISVYFVLTDRPARPA